MTEPGPSLTTEDVKRLLAQLGCAGEGDGPPRCPVCKTAELTITTNGSGPHLACANGCGHIGAYLQAIAALPMPKGSHVDRLAVLRDKLALPELERVVKHGRRGDEYELHLAEDVVVELGPIANITQQSRFRNAYLPQVRRNPPRYKNDVWDQIAELIEQVAEEVSAATGNEELIGWLTGYLRNQTLKRHVDLDATSALHDLLKASCEVFIDTDGCLHLRLAAFAQWVNRMVGVRVSVPELSTRLTKLGFRRKQHTARKGDEIANGRYWISPPNVESTLW
jgi:hypothetical protein